MPCHAVVALARATVDGRTLFGQKSAKPAGSCPPLCRTSGHAGAPDEKVRTQLLELPQARQTYAVLGSQPDGRWGYEYGINEHQLAVGCVKLSAKMSCDGPTLLGTDLVRLTLERSRTALQGVDLLTSLVERHGQGSFRGCPAEAECDCAFLVADATEAYAVETAGHYWVYQEVQEVRAVSDVRVIRQDWDRIAPGLASYAISQGWWADDGSKLDFVGALGDDPVNQGPALRRWGQATVALMEQNGRIDTAFLRRLLREQLDLVAPRSGRLLAGEEDVRWFQHPAEKAGSAAVASFVASLTQDLARLPMSWCAFGPLWGSVYFPLFLDGEIPEPFQHGGRLALTESLWQRVSRLGELSERDPERGVRVRDQLARFQARLDQDAEEFNAEGSALRQRGALADLQRQATLFMQYNLERFETVLADSLRSPSLIAVSR
ncbi:MAG TPA: hypothetical protein VKU02_17590 [Gemmataceae bacterium]|nr:hypothetical protein [Gemmataceae bacterium]